MLQIIKINKLNMYYKNKVLHVYPNAILLRDHHNYGNPPGGKFNFIIIKNVPISFKEKIKNGILDTDYYVSFPTDKLCPLSHWCLTEKESWKDAWEKIEKKMVEILE